MTNQHCFHCDLPVVDKSPPVSEFEGQTKTFCCHGCKAVCDVIVSSGNADYYKYREGSARTFNANDLPVILNQLKIYDNEDIQREFILSGKNAGWKEVWLILEEIRCAACMWLNEQTLRKLEGVLDVQMDYTGQQARVRWDPDKIKLSDILTAITNIGYYAHPFDASQRESLNKEQKQRSLHRIIFALILGMAVMQSSIGGYFFGADGQGKFPLWLQISRWVNVISTLLILAYPGQLFFRNAWRDIKNKSLGMDVPIVIGLSVAWLGSLYSTITDKGDVYFESIAMFVIFLLIARHIELRTRITATALLDRTAKIIPQTTHLLLGNHEQIKEIPVIELEKGDHIRVSPGETLPVDGRLLSSRSSFDESLLTGESLPVVHEQGEELLGGSINIDQVIEVEVLATKADSTLNDIHQLTQKSVNYRPYYVDLAESVAGKFVAIILLIAVTTFLFWNWSDSANALSHTISVLIVTCPCALALAAPVALSLGAAGLSHLHVLAIRMSSMEKLSHIDTLVFDKTGTLTLGSPKVEDIICVGSTDVMDEETALAIAATLEQGSQHPFAKAILQAAKQQVNAECQAGLELDVVELKQFPGKGIEGTMTMNTKKSLWKLGNEIFVGIGAGASLCPETLSDSNKALIAAWQLQGNSTLFLSKDSVLQAVFFLKDPLRDGVEQFIAQSRELGIKQIHILSGDHEQSVKAVAGQLGIMDSHGGLSPQDKLDWIQERQSKGHKIMMLGDGINDAPTLSVADVSLTFSDATDLAKNSCDFILLGKDYLQLGSALSLMKRTRSIILQNLGWAVAYNVLAIPAAALGMITPWMAAIGMSVSSLIVVLNSLRLRKQA